MPKFNIFNRNRIVNEDTPPIVEEVLSSPPDNEAGEMSFDLLSLISSIDLFTLLAIPPVVLLFLVYWVYIRPIYWKQIYQLLQMKFTAVIKKKGSFSFADEFEKCVDANPDKVQFTMCENGEQFTLMDMEKLANRMAHWAMKKGFQQNDVVALYMQNHPDFVSFWMGFAKAGVSCALLNTNITGESLIHSCESVLKDSETKVILVDIELADQVRNDISELEKKGIMVVFWETSMAAFLGKSVKSDQSSVVSLSSSKNEISESPANTSGKRGSFTKRRSSKILSMFTRSPSGTNMDTMNDPPEAHTSLINAEVASLSDKRPTKECREEITKESAFFYIFTSGSTGLPKACKLSMFRVYGASTFGRVISSSTPKDRYYCVLPLYHSAASCFLACSCIKAGVSVFLRRKFSASQFSNDCVTYKITGWQYIGELCRYLVATPPSPLDKDVRLRVAFGNGLRPEVWNEFKTKYNVQNIVEYYAATEGNIILWNAPGKTGALGQLPYFADLIYPVTILRTDPEDQTVPLRDPKTGLCIRCKVGEVGLMVMPIDPFGRERRFEGYKDANATKKKILTDVLRKGDQCFNTGDLLSRDAEGFFYWSDRVGDTFRWKGENCATSEVAAVISKSDGVYDCCVYGVTIPNCDGRAGMAIIALTQDAADAGIGSTKAGSFDIEKFQTLLATQLPVYSRPMFLRIKLRGEIPQTNTFKHTKGVLVKEGYDPSMVDKDLLYYYDIKEKKYQSLNMTSYRDIMAGMIKF